MKAIDRQPLSLSARLMVFVGLSIGISLVLVGNLVLVAVKHHFAEQDAGELIVMNEAVVEALRNAVDDPARLREALSNAVSGHHGVYFQVRNQQGEVIYGTPGADLTQAATTLNPAGAIQVSNLQTWNQNNATFRGVLTQNDAMGQRYSIATAIDMSFHLEFLRNFRRSLWFIMSIAGALTLVAAWYGVYQAHAPLRRLSGRMGDVQADRLDVRLDRASVPAELRGLVNSFNHMISRLEDSFTRLSHFSADIAHELRTPLTNLITQTQVGLGKARTSEEYRELLYSNLEEQERLAKMVNDMLWLAKADHGLIKPAQVPLDLSSEIKELFDFFEALAEERNIRLTLEGQAKAIYGDRAMLRRAISNLLSNAMRHTASGEVVLVRLDSASEHEIALSVENPGPEIPIEHLPNIFNRFHRIDPSRARQSEGAGLGLAIVRSIVEAHGGRAEASSANSRTTITLFFPAAE